MATDPIADLITAIDANDNEGAKRAAVALATECLSLARRAVEALEKLAGATPA